MMINSDVLRERLNNPLVIDWIDDDKSPASYKRGYLSGLIKALVTLGEVEYFTEHGEDREPIDFEFSEDTARGLKALTGTVADKVKELELQSHSERDIVEQCIGLMESVHQNMLEYMEYMGFEYDRENEEEVPQFIYSYFEIVQRLLLSRTRHSGGTSTRRKCEQLELDSYETLIIGEIESDGK